MCGKRKGPAHNNFLFQHEEYASNIGISRDIIHSEAKIRWEKERLLDKLLREGRDQRLPVSLFDLPK